MQIHLPKELLEVPNFEADFQFFIDTMVHKLHINRHRGFIEGKTLSMLWLCLDEEMKELTQALAHESQFNVMLECVDTANFAFLIAMACLQKTKKDFTEERVQK